MNDLRCPVCAQTFNDPRVLPCGENLCKKCIPSEVTFSCIFCNEIHQVPPGGFPPNRYIVKAIESTSLLDVRLEHEIQAKIERVRSKLSDGPNLLKQTCSRLRERIQLHRDTIVAKLTSMSDSMISEVNDYELNSLDSLQKSSEPFCAELNDKLNTIESHLKAKTGELQDPTKALTADKQLLDELSAQIDQLIFNERHMCFAESSKEISRDFVGSFFFADSRVELANERITVIDLKSVASFVKFYGGCQVRVELMANNHFVITSMSKVDSKLYLFITDAAFQLRNQHVFAAENCIQHVLNVCGNKAVVVYIKGGCQLAVVDETTSIRSVKLVDTSIHMTTVESCDKCIFVLKRRQSKIACTKVHFSVEFYNWNLEPVVHKLERFFDSSVVAFKSANQRFYFCYDNNVMKILDHNCRLIHCLSDFPTFATYSFRVLAHNNDMVFYDEFKGLLVYINEKGERIGDVSLTPYKSLLLNARIIHDKNDDVYVYGNEASENNEEFFSTKLIKIESAFA